MSAGVPGKSGLAGRRQTGYFGKASANRLRGWWNWQTRTFEGRMP